MIFKMLNYFSQKVQRLLVEIKGKPVVMLIGQTGSGKSTFGTALFNYFKSGGKKLGVDEKAQIKDGKEIFKQGSESESVTFIPQTEFIQATGEYLLDNPGIGENRGLILNLFQALIFKKILKNASSVKFVILVTSHSYQAVRGESLKETMNFLKQSLGRKFLEENKQGFLALHTKY